MLLLQVSAGGPARLRAGSRPMPVLFVRRFGARCGGIVGLLPASCLGRCGERTVAGILFTLYTGPALMPCSTL